MKRQKTTKDSVIDKRKAGNQVVRAALAAMEECGYERVRVKVKVEDSDSEGGR